MLFRILVCCLHVRRRRIVSFSEQTGLVADASATHHGSQQHLSPVLAEL